MDSISLLKLSHCAPWECGQIGMAQFPWYYHITNALCSVEINFFFFLDSSCLFKPLQILNVTEPSLAQTHYHLQI